MDSARRERHLVDMHIDGQVDRLGQPLGDVDTERRSKGLWQYRVLREILGNAAWRTQDFEYANLRIKSGYLQPRFA